MSEFFPPNWTPLEYALAKSISRVSNVPIPFEPIWNPATCPETLVPWLAWAFSVDAWDSTWTDAQKRAVIAQSVSIHRQKGTVGSVQAIVSALGMGGAVLLQEWWQTVPKGPAHTFQVTIASTNLAADIQNSLVAAITRVKPVRSSFSVVNVNGFAGKINAVGYASPTLYTRLEFAATYTPPNRFGLVTNTGLALVTNTGAQLATN